MSDKQPEEKPPEASNIHIYRRNPGHWDICVNERGRVFAIRGGPGDYYVRDERRGEKATNAAFAYKFASLPMAVAWAVDILMYELIVAEGQEPTKIEAWNVGNRF